MYRSDGERKFIFHIGNTPAVLAPSPDAKALEGLKFFHIMGCSLMADTAFGRRIVQTMHAARAAGAKIAFDPNVRPELMKDPQAGELIQEVLEHTSIFLPGKNELKTLAGQQEIEQAVAALFAAHPGMEIIALKNGKKGCVIYTRQEQIAFGVYAVPPVDATGAGDSFDAARFSAACWREKTCWNALKWQLPRPRSRSIPARSGLWRAKSAGRASGG